MHCGFFDGKMIQVVSGPEGSLGGEDMPGKTLRDGSSLIETNAMMIVESIFNYVTTWLMIQEYSCIEPSIGVLNIGLVGLKNLKSKQGQ